MSDVKDGKKTSERRGALLVHAITTVAAIMSFIAANFADIPWIAQIVVPFSVLASAIVQSSYIQSRTDVKVAAEKP